MAGLRERLDGAAWMFADSIAGSILIQQEAARDAKRPDARIVERILVQLYRTSVIIGMTPLAVIEAIDAFFNLRKPQ